jgi:16S rRNA (guanine527-N7)-methyltransferase
MKDFKDIFISASQEIGINLENREINLFQKYYEELIFWNTKISLVSRKSTVDIPIKHFIDSLTILPFIDDKKTNLLDIGSGAGFPGIPIKIVMHSLEVSLMDSSRKKTSFLKNVVQKLNLERTFVINARAERLIAEENNTGAFDIVISRASFKLSQFIQTGSPFLSEKGILIAMKGKQINDEIKEAEKVAQKLKLILTGHHDIKLPVTGDARKIIIFQKSS